MTPLVDFQRLQTRRQIFGSTGLRLGGVALASMLGSAVGTSTARAVEMMNPPLPGLPHFAPRRRR